MGKVSMVEQWQLPMVGGIGERVGYLVGDMNTKEVQHLLEITDSIEDVGHLVREMGTREVLHVLETKDLIEDVCYHKLTGMQGKWATEVLMRMAGVKTRVVG